MRASRSGCLTSRCVRTLLDDEWHDLYRSLQFIELFDTDLVPMTALPSATPS